MTHYKVAIVGSGPAGLTAAIYLGRAQAKPIIFVGPEPGGQLTRTSDVGNFPGFIDDIQGPELMERMTKQAKRYDVEYVQETVEKVNFSKKPFTLTSASMSVTADAVILATGASAKWLGLPNEQRLRGKGVSGCATCDGFFFKGKDVVVVGGGDTAMEDATFLTKFAKSVTVIHRRDSLAASKIMQDRARANKKIRFLFNAEVVDVKGDDAVTGVTIKDIPSGNLSEKKVQGLFIAIGHKPNTDFLEGHVALERGYIKVSEITKTSVDGVFAGGDAHDFRYRQAVTAAGFGCMAALDAEKYLAEHEQDSHASTR